MILQMIVFSKKISNTMFQEDMYKFSKGEGMYKIFFQ